MRKKAQETGSAAATVIGIIALLIVFYILFLPADERAVLLGEEPPGSGSSGTSSSDSGSSEEDLDIPDAVLLVSPGKIDYTALDEYEYNLPSFTIYKTTNSVVLDSTNNFFIKNGWFDKTVKNFTFEIDELEHTEDILLSFIIGKKKGQLIISLNGNEIYNFEPKQLNIEPLELSKSYLKEGKNNLEFRVSDVGMQFWGTNEYTIENLKITGSFTDISRQESKNYFYITQEEGNSIKSATLKFNPDCKVSETGYIEVYLNNIQVFSGIPDCGILNTYMLSPSILNIGKNSLRFTTKEGSYLIDQVLINTKLEDPTYPTYYFDLDEQFFYSKETLTDKCGEIDGKCPENCDEDLDKDCCFEEYTSAYWCDIPTEIEGDRCVGYVETFTCARCDSGYEDSSGRSPEECEGMCGDDKDGECPDGCITYHDKDCCFELEGDQYWCNNLPVTGVSYACLNEVGRNNCRNCPGGYTGEGTNPECEDIEADSEKEDRLKKDYNILLKFEFTERGNDKEAVLWVNNHETGFDTRESLWIKNIDAFVEPNTNSIKVMPKTELEIKEIKVYFDE